jgi:hypothetical protein
MSGLDHYLAIPIGDLQVVTVTDTYGIRDLFRLTHS